MPTRYLGGEVWVEAPSKGLAGGGRSLSADVAGRWLQALYETPLLFSGILDSDGAVLDANELSIEGCGLERSDIIGRPFWEGGWWSPDGSLAVQVRSWCRQVIATGRALRTTTHYFLGDGSMRMVDLSLHPVQDEHRPGSTGWFIVAYGLDVTDALVARAEREESLQTRAAGLERRSETQAEELAATVSWERVIRDRLARLASAAVDMVGADTVEELTAIVFNSAFPIIDADGGALVIRDGEALRVHLSDQMDDLTKAKYTYAPLDSPLPGRYVARTGERLLFPNRAAGLAFLVDMAQVYVDTKRYAWVYLPLERNGRLLGSLAISWDEERNFSDEELALMESIAAQCAQVIDRIQITQSNAEHTRQIERMVESMQRSLLTSSPTHDDLDIASIYLPAGQAVQVGGDWYDALTTKTGSTLLAVGDVAGHDGDSAATMAQLRNLFRGIAVPGSYRPAELLTLLEEAMVTLGLEAVATLLVIEMDPLGPPSEGFHLRWASAGHPPPMVKLPDGSVSVLAEAPQLLLGAVADITRRDWGTDLPPGSSLLLYTDGLIERRGEPLDVGLERLARVLRDVPSRPSQEWCEQIVARMAPENPDDDIVLLAVTRRQLP